MHILPSLWSTRANSSYSYITQEQDTHMPCGLKQEKNKAHRLSKSCHLASVHALWCCCVGDCQTVKQSVSGLLLCSTLSMFIDLEQRWEKLRSEGKWERKGDQMKWWKRDFRQKTGSMQRRRLLVDTAHQSRGGGKWEHHVRLPADEPGRGSSTAGTLTAHSLLDSP